MASEIVALPLPDRRIRDESELSDWQSGAEKPSQPGLYLRDLDGEEVLSHFVDGEWSYDGFFPSHSQDADWRGLKPTGAVCSSTAPLF